MVYEDFLILTGLIMLLMSCRENISTKNDVDVSSDTNSSVIETRYSFNFPDTVIVGQIYKGTIKYISPLDTIKLKERDRRYLWFYARGNVDMITLKELFKVEHDTFVSIGSGIIPVNNIVFNKKGENYINGYIEDQVVIEGY